MSQKSNAPVIVGAVVAGVVAISTVVGMIVAIKKLQGESSSTGRKYTWYPGKDMSMISSTYEILDYVSEKETKKHCDAIAASGKRCDAAVKYGPKVYYRQYLTTSPKDWQGSSPDPKTDGTWAWRKKLYHIQKLDSLL